MLISTTTIYALRAVYFLLTHSESNWYQAKDIAKATNIPRPYLARLLSIMAKRGILRSRTGIGGGFKVNERKLETSLYEVTSLFENLDEIQDCIFGLIDCCREKKCSLHEGWQDLRERLIKLLESTTLAELRDHRQFIDWSKVKV